jgi:hypothetical protein
MKGARAPPHGRGGVAVRRAVIARDDPASAGRALSRASICSSFPSSTSAILSDAASISRPSSDTAPRPSRAASAIAATIRRVFSAAAASGVNTSLASSICDGWIAHLPS